VRNVSQADDLPQQMPQADPGSAPQNQGVSHEEHNIWSCNIPHHAELLGRAEGAEERCRALEARLRILESQPADGRSASGDNLQDALQQARASEVFCTGL
jgi:hypothetical protein